MGLIMWLIVGGLVGWIASIIMKTNEQQGIVLNVVVGIVGSFLAGLVGARSINSGITIGSIAISILGAVALLALINLARRGRVR
jgi:uncharacterized membrane protein YeaQ/YmgE (transglycosylase-associated protein family)